MLILLVLGASSTWYQQGPHEYGMNYGNISGYIPLSYLWKISLRHPSHLMLGSLVLSVLTFKQLVLKTEIIYIYILVLASIMNAFTWNHVSKWWIGCKRLFFSWTVIFAFFVIPFHFSHRSFFYVFFPSLCFSLIFFSLCSRAPHCTFVSRCTLMSHCFSLFIVLSLLHFHYFH